MKMEDIRPAEDIPRFREYIDTVSATVYKGTRWNHRKKDGTVLDVEVTAQDFPYFVCLHLPPADPGPPSGGGHTRVSRGAGSHRQHTQSRIDARLVQNETLFERTVSDDGIGLSTTTPQGMGIMDYRARIIGGIFAVHPGAAGGTMVPCRFPNTSFQQPAD